MRLSDLLKAGRWPILVTIALLLLTHAPVAWAADGPSYVATEAGAERFALATGGQPAPIYVSADDHAGVIRATEDLQADLGRVTGAAPVLATDDRPASKTMILVGTLGKSPLIDRLVQEKKLNAAGVAGRGRRS